MTTRIYRVRITFPQQNRDEVREYTATALGEALLMAERDIAGSDATVAIRPEDYAQAHAEGLSFNEADGLLI